MAAPPVRVTWLQRTEISPAGSVVDAVLRATATGEATLTRLGVWRIFQIGIYGAASSLGPAPPIAEKTDQGTDVVIRVARSINAQHLDWQQALMSGLLVLQLAKPGGGLAQLPEGGGSWYVQTEAEQPAIVERTQAPETGGIPIVVGIVLIVIAAGAIAAGMLYDAQQAEIQVKKIAADSKQKTLAQNLAAAAMLIDKHQEREKSQGTTIPYDEAELLLLSKLNASIGDVAKWTPGPLKTIPDVRELSKETGRAIKKVGEGASTGATLGLLLAVYLLIEGN